jgi:hypothetical protein
VSNLASTATKPSRAVGSRVLDRLRWAIVFVISALAITSRAQEMPAAVHGIDGSFIKEWLVLGPLPSDAIAHDFLGESGGELAARPSEGDALRTSDGKTLIWKRYNVICLQRTT